MYFVIESMSVHLRISIIFFISIEYFRVFFYNIYCFVKYFISFCLIVLDSLVRNIKKTITQTVKSYLHSKKYQIYLWTFDKIIKFNFSFFARSKKKKYSKIINLFDN